MRKINRVATILAITLITIVIILFITGGILLRTIFGIDEVRENTIKSEPLAELNLSKKQMLKDFNTYYKIAVTSIPNISEYPEAFGWDFESRYDLYKSEIEKCNNDFDFYCIMTAISNDIFSCHTGFFGTEYDDIINYCCLNNATILTDKLEETTYYWDNLLKQTVKETDFNLLRFTYVDGEYVNNTSCSTINAGECTLVNIDGISPDEYIKSNVSQFKIIYDNSKNKVYRSNIIFNDTQGTKVKATVINKNGETKTLDLYADIRIDTLYIYNYLANQQDLDSFMPYFDDKSKISYIAINNLDNEDDIKEFYNTILNKDTKGVIVDIRDNGGGTLQFLQAVVYPALFNKDITVDYCPYMLKSTNNRKGYFDYLYIFEKNINTYKEKGNNGRIQNYNYVERSERFNGNSNIKHLYILTAINTGSAADMFAYVAKQNDNVTLIGQNTGGEGFIDTSIMDILPNSKLVFLYCPYKCYTPEGINNSLYGTAPDIYAEQSIEGYYKKQQIISDGQDPYTYENRLKWDDVLIKTLELIEEENNDKTKDTDNK